MINYSKELKGQPIAVVDIETTGVNEKTSKILAVGAVKMLDGEVVDTFYSLVNVGEPLTEEAVELTGITNEDLIDGVDIKSALAEFSTFCKGCVVASHQLPFYNRFIMHALKELNDPDISFSKKQIDILHLARRVFFGEIDRFSLLHLAEYLSIEIKDLDVKNVVVTSTQILKSLLYRDIDTQPLGVFWVKENKIILEDYRIQDKKQVVNFYSHLEVCGKYKKEFMGKPYDYYPRGRIVFDEKKNKIVLYIDKSIAQSNIEQLLNTLGYEPDMVEICIDENYICPKSKNVVD